MKDPWVVEYVNKCTCYGGSLPEYGHEPRCGITPIDYYDECISPSSAFDFSNEPNVEVLR